jgi:hypothetical protein
MDHRELTLADLLADLAVMAADRVDPAELKSMLCAVVRRRQLDRSAERSQVRDRWGVWPG